MRIIGRKSILGSSPGLLRTVRFFLDHDVPVEVARVLRHEGYEVIELREVLPVRASDVEVFTITPANTV
jgi:predicted nuclease of predicted toxin-antitoxin system